MKFPIDSRKVVGCDLDDVLADFIKKFMEVAGKKYGVNPDLRPTSWEWDDVQMSAEMVDGTWAEILATPNWWETLEVEDGADIIQIHRVNNATRLIFPTARAICPGRGVEVQSGRWLYESFDLMWPTVIVANDKGPLAAALKYDFFIDDRPKNCVEVKQASPRTRVFLKNASHNQGVVLAEIPRVQDFNEFSKIVLEG